MILSVEERLVLLSLLPQQGNYATLKIMTELRLSLSFNEDEMKKWSIEHDAESGRTSWQENGESEIPIGEKATDAIIEALKRRDAEGTLPMQALGLYEKFIPTE